MNQIYYYGLVGMIIYVVLDTYNRHKRAYNTVPMKKSIPRYLAFLAYSYLIVTINIAAFGGIAYLLQKFIEFIQKIV